MNSIYGVFLWAVACQAVVPIQDPSDIINPSDWAADNAIVPDLDPTLIAVLPSPILAAYTYNSSANVRHDAFSVSANDTSVIFVTDGANFSASYIDVLKYGYSSSLSTASFYGSNAAIHVANGSAAKINHANITVHNGASNIHAYGTGTKVSVDYAYLYSSGPASHGLHATGNGTIISRNIQHFSGGRRSPSFAGGSPAGHIFAYDSLAHTQNVGSATFHALGSIYANNIISLSEKAPALLMDGAQNATLVNCDCTAGLLGGAAIFSSAARTSGAQLVLRNTKITALGESTPGLWFGNTVVDVTIHSSTIETTSGILVAANTSQIAPGFDHYAGSNENPSLLPARVSVRVTESALEGDLVAYNGSYVSWSLSNYTYWTGGAYSGLADATFDVALDRTSNWTLTGAVRVQSFTDEDPALSNIWGGGFNLSYNASAALNGWLGEKEIALQGGGFAVAYSG